MGTYYIDHSDTVVAAILSNPPTPQAALSDLERFALACLPRYPHARDQVHELVSIVRGALERGHA